MPAFFLPKTKWRNYAETVVAEDSCRENYVSARQQAKVAQEQFEGEARLGAMLEMPMSEAVEKFGKSLAIASLGALEKRDGSYRVIHDATHGLDVNSAIRMRDQVPTATAGELRALLQTEPGVTFGLTGDVKRAHRLVKIDPLDWGRQACRTDESEGGKVWLNLVGTFGVSSAAYHWCRLMAGLGRSAYYMLGKAEVEQLVYVDDLLWLTRDREGVETIVVIVFYYVLMGLPFSWKKFIGGTTFQWVGFELVLKGAKLGISLQRAQWLIRWLNSTAQAGQVKVADMQAVLGRLSFALTALGHLRPFLGPMYAWGSSNAGPEESCCAESIGAHHALLGCGAAR